MATVTRTSMEAVLKEMYLPGLTSHYYSMTPIYHRIKKVTAANRPDMFTGGKYAVIAAKTNRAQNMGYRAEDEALPTAQGPSVDNMQVQMKYGYATIKLSGPVKAAMTGGRTAFANALTLLMEDAKEGLAYECAIQLVFGDGTGVIAYTNGAGSGSTALTVDTPGTTHMQDEMYIDIYTSGGSQEVNNVRVSSITSSTAAVLASSSTWSDNSYVYRKGNRNNVAMGLAGIVDDGTRVATFQTKTRSTDTWLKANVLSNSGINRALTLRLVDDMVLKARKTLTTSGVSPTAIYSRCAIQQNYAELLRADRRYSPKDMVLNGGYSAVEVSVTGNPGPLPWILDEMCRPNEVWAVHEPDLMMLELKPMGWLENGGTILSKSADGSDSEQAELGVYHNLAAIRCNSHSSLKDITEG